MILVKLGRAGYLVRVRRVYDEEEVKGGSSQDKRHGKSGDLREGGNGERADWDYALMVPPCMKCLN